MQDSRPHDTFATVVPSFEYQSEDFLTETDPLVLPGDYDSQFNQEHATQPVVQQASPHDASPILVQSFANQSQVDLPGNIALALPGGHHGDMIPIIIKWKGFPAFILTVRIRRWSTVAELRDNVSF